MGFCGLFKQGLAEETKIVTLSEEQQQQQPPARLPPLDFNFITECFYLTHNSLRLSYITLYQKLLKVNQELSRWQSTYQQIVESGNGSDPNQQKLKTLYEKMTCEFLNVKSALLGICIEPSYYYYQSSTLFISYY